MEGGLNDIEASAFAAPLNAGQKADGGSVDYCIVSIAISLKRIADALAPERGQDIGTTLWYIEQLKRGRIDP